MKKIQVYLAGSMFCEADRMYNALLAEKIRERVGNYTLSTRTTAGGNLNEK